MAGNAQTVEKSTIHMRPLVNVVLLMCEMVNSFSYTYSNMDFPEVGSPGFLYAQKYQQNPKQIKFGFYVAPWKRKNRDAAPA